MKSKMKNRSSTKLCQKNLFTEKNTMSWENIPASLTCRRAKIPPRKKIILFESYRLWLREKKSHSKIFEVQLPRLKKVDFICLIENHVKMMKNFL